MQQDGVTIGLRAGDFRGRNHPASAADILDHDRLAKLFLHGILKDARGRVVGATGRERDYKSDRPIGIALRQSAACPKTCGENRGRERAGENHFLLPVASIVLVRKFRLFVNWLDVQPFPVPAQDKC